MNIISFLIASIVLLFIPGYVYFRKKKIDENMLAKAFVISSGLLFVVTLILSKTIGLNFISLIGFIAIGTIVLSFQSANL